ncbi:hypothetical protein PO909_005662 [Leuciscus waleckii]
MSSNELSAPESDPCIRTFKEHMHLELEPPRLGTGNKRITSPKISPRSSPRLFRKLMVNKGGRHRRRFTVAHTCVAAQSITFKRRFCITQNNNIARVISTLIT